MGDKPELLHVPQANAALVVSETCASLIARARKDASNIALHNPEPKLLAAVMLEGKWGLIDRHGSYVVRPSYYKIASFSCGRAAFSNSFVGEQLWNFARRPNRKHNQEILSSAHPDFSPGCWGYLDENGRVAITPRFPYVRQFSEGLAGVMFEGGWGFINKDGDFVLRANLGGVGDFKDGQAIVRSDGRCGIIDRYGRFAVRPKFDFLWEFFDGLACVEVDCKYGYIGRDGEFVIQPQFDWASDFRRGMATVREAERFSEIDKTGRVLFHYGDGAYSLGDFTDGVALVRNKCTIYAEQCGHDVQFDCECEDYPCSCVRSEVECEECSFDYSYYIDIQGREILLDEGIQAVCEFSDGLGLVEKSNCDVYDARDKLYGYVDTAGRVKIPLRYAEASAFKNRRAAVSEDGKTWTLINSEGMRVGSSSFEGIDEFQEGLARMDTGHTHGFNGKYGFIDSEGLVVIEPRFAWLTNFNNGIARFSDKNCMLYDRTAKWGFIDKAGKIIVPCQFEAAKDFEQVALENFRADVVG